MCTICTLYTGHFNPNMFKYLYESMSVTFSPVSALVEAKRGKLFNSFILDYANIQFPSVDKCLPGYPQFAAWLSYHPCFRAYRKLSRLRTRVLFKKQDKFARLEEQLQLWDKKDFYPVFRCSFRRDQKEDRSKIISEIESCLKDRGKHSSSHRRKLSKPSLTGPGNLVD